MDSRVNTRGFSYLPEGFQASISKTQDRPPTYTVSQDLYVNKFSVFAFFYAVLAASLEFKTCPYA
jgi:hypothetical protein